MIIKRYMKAGLRILRNKEGKNLGRYEFLTFPLQEGAMKKKAEDVDFVCFIVIFFFENAFHHISKQIDELQQKNPKLKVAVLTAFSNIKYLTSLSKAHQKMTIINVLCITDFKKFSYALKKNCEIGNVNLLLEEYYRNKLLHLAYKYRQKHTPAVSNEPEAKTEEQKPADNASQPKADQSTEPSAH